MTRHVNDIETSDGRVIPTGEWTAGEPPVCPTCGCPHDYAAWEARDHVRALYAERNALRERVARLRRYAAVIEEKFIEVSLDRDERADKSDYDDADYLHGMISPHAHIASFRGLYEVNGDLAEPVQAERKAVAL